MPLAEGVKVLPATVSADNEYRERFNREAELDGRADQLTLADTAFHLLTGQPPFAEESPVP